jgi:hypothetical protein
MTYLDWDSFVPWIDLESPRDVLSASIRLLDLCDRFGIVYGGAGANQYKAICLWHKDGQENTPSLTLYDDTNQFHCHACHIHGGVIELTAKQLGYNRPPPGTIGYNVAVEELAKLAGLSSGDVSNLPTIKKRPPEETVIFYAAQLTPKLREFLRSKEDHYNYERYKEWVDRRFVELDTLMDLDNDEWNRVKVFCDTTIAKIEGNK